MFYESLAFNEGGNDGFWRFQLRDRFGRWIKMGGSAMFEFRKPNDKNVYRAKGTFQGNIRRGWSIIRVGEGEQLPPGDYEIDSRYIESIKAIINTTSAKPETVDAPKSINPDVEKQATEREMVAATVKDLEAGDIVQQSTEKALYGQINSVEHGDAESKINVTWSDGSNYDMTLPGDQKIRVWGAEPEVETVDAGDIKEPSHDRLNVPDGQETSSDVLKYSQSREVADFVSSHFDYSETPEHVSAVNIYVGDDASTLERNKNLREGLDASEMQELDAWTNGGTVSSPVRVYRGIIASDEVADSYIVGSVVSDKSFVSAAVNKQQALVYQIAREQDGAKGKRITFMIDLDEGVHAGVAHMGEVVLPRGTDFEVVSNKVLKSGNRAITLRVKAKPEPVDAPKPKSRFEAPTDPAEIEALKAKAEEQKARVAEVEKEREERLKLKAEQEAKAAESYRMAHRPPGRSDTDEEGVAASLDKIDQVFSQGILDPEKQQSLFRTGDAEADKETFDIINSIKGNPDAEVTIYRGVPDGVDAIGAGDWVTLSPSYAQHHVDANVPDGKVISMKVKASELFTNADSINEWGYDPEPETVDAPKVETEEDKVSAIWGNAAPNERDVVAAAYEKLPADMPIADVAVLDPDFATYPDSIKNDPESVKEVAIGAMQEIVRRWNGSSIYDDSTKALHEVAREHFGISGATPVEMTEGSKALMENKEAYKAVLDAIYASTQEMFAGAGIEEITVYRGSKTDSSGVRPLSSWTTDKATAEAFAGKDGDTREMTVPVSQVLSTAMSGGLGAWNENEVVLLGSPKTVDAGNVEEEAPEVPEATRVIDSQKAAAELVEALAKKIGSTQTSSVYLAKDLKRNAAKVVVDKMLAAGISLEQIAAATKGPGVSVIKYSSDESDVLDSATIANKIPEQPGNYDFLNMPYDDNTVVEASASKINVMKFEDGQLQIFTFPDLDTTALGDIAGKTFKEVETAINEEPLLSGYYGKLSVVGTSESKRMLAEYWTSNMIHIWANTSNDADPYSLAIQETAKTMFGLTESAPWDVNEETGKKVKDNLDSHGAVYEAFLRAQYDATQEFFAEQGVKAFKLFRGFTSKFKVETGYTDTTLRPLSSFSTRESQAEEFALPDNFDYGYLVEMMVPVEDILAIPGFGIGCHEEDEVVVLGGKKSAWISS